MTDFEKAQRHLCNAMNALSCLGADDLADQVHAVFKENARRRDAWNTEVSARRERS